MSDDFASVMNSKNDLSTGLPDRTAKTLGPAAPRPKRRGGAKDIRSALQGKLFHARRYKLDDDAELKKYVLKRNQIGRDAGNVMVYERFSQDDTVVMLGWYGKDSAVRDTSHLEPERDADGKVTSPLPKGYPETYTASTGMIISDDDIGKLHELISGSKYVEGGGDLADDEEESEG